jgi:hypothetical protein
MRCRGVRFLAIVAAAGCWSATPAPVEQPEVRLATSSVDPEGKTYVIGTIVSITPECGGGFVMKTLDRNPAQRVLVRGRVKLDALYVAELLPGSEECFFDSQVNRVVPVATMSEAQRIAAQVRRTGFANTIVLRPHQGPETISIARVIHVRGRQIRLEPIRGEVPAWIDMPFHERRDPVIGDRIVVASAHGTPTRVLVTSNIEDATRWESSIFAEGWPPDVVVVD